MDTERVQKTGADIYLAFRSRAAIIGRMLNHLRAGYFAFIALVVFLVCSALMVGGKPLSYYFDFGRSPWMVATWMLPLVLWISWIGTLVVYRKFDRPTVGIYRLSRRHSAWILRGVLLPLLVLPAARAFSTFKQAIPHYVPFYADPTFAYADKMLFLGHDPWRVSHALIGPFGTMILDRIYLLWFPLMFGLMAWFIFTRDMRFQLRGLLSFFLTTTLLGNALAMAWASVGPCFYETFYGSTQYRPLMDMLRADHAVYPIKAFATMEWLFANQEKWRFGSGISAMPSVHVAIAFLLCLVVYNRTRSKWLRAIVSINAFAVWVGSFHLAWHYAVDGLVSIVGVAAIWWASGRFVAWVDARPETSSSVARGAPLPEMPVFVGTSSAH